MELKIIWIGAGARGERGIINECHLRVKNVSEGRLDSVSKKSKTLRYKPSEE